MMAAKDKNKAKDWARVSLGEGRAPASPEILMETGKEEQREW